MAVDGSVSFHKLLEQALTFGVKRVSRSVLPQFIGFIVYIGLIAAVWVTFTYKLDYRIADAGVGFLAVAAIMTILLLIGTRISPLVLDILVVIVVIGFLGVGSWAVVKIVQPDQPREMNLTGNLRYADQTSARDYIVTLEGHQNGVRTGDDGYFDLPISNDDIHNQKVNLHIESIDHKYGENQSITINLATTTRATIVLRVPPSAVSVAPSKDLSSQDVKTSSAAHNPRHNAKDTRGIAGRDTAFLLGYDAALALAHAKMGKLNEQEKARIDAYLRQLNLDTKFPSDPLGPNGDAEPAAEFASLVLGSLEAKSMQQQHAFALGWLGVITTNTPSMKRADFNVKTFADEAGFKYRGDLSDAAILEQLSLETRQRRR